MCWFIVFLALRAHTRAIDLLHVHCRLVDDVQGSSQHKMATPALWERKLLLGTTAGTVFAFLIQIVALATNHWLTFEIPDGLYFNKTGRYLYESYSGLWRICTTEFTKSIGSNGQEIKTYRKYENILLHVHDLLLTKHCVGVSIKDFVNLIILNYSYCCVCRQS